MTSSNQSNKPIYLDNASTTKMSPLSLNGMMNILKNEFGNPSSIHRIGQNAKEIVDDTRERFASYFSASENEIFFTSGATESNATIIRGFAASNQKGILTTKIEHSSVIENCEFLRNNGFSVHYLDVDKVGQIDLDELEKTLESNTIGLVSIALVNHEIGSVANYREISMICRKHGVLFHTDATQAIGHIDADWSCFDAITASAHKIHGPKGVGVLVKRKCFSAAPLIFGGGQELGFRGGTENTAAIYAFGLALKETERLDTQKRIESLFNEFKKQIESNLTFKHRINTPAVSSKNILSVTIFGFDADSVVTSLSSRGIYVSSGSACINNDDAVSKTIYEITGSKSEARSTIRISFSIDNEIDEAKYFVDSLNSVLSAISVFQ